MCISYPLGEVKIKPRSLIVYKESVSTFWIRVSIQDRQEKVSVVALSLPCLAEARSSLTPGKLYHLFVAYYNLPLSEDSYFGEL